MDISTNHLHLSIVVILSLIATSFNNKITSKRPNHHNQVKPAIDDIGERVAPVIEGVGQQVHIKSYTNVFTPLFNSSPPKGSSLYWPARNIFNSKANLTSSTYFHLASNQ